MLVLDNSITMCWCFEDQRTDYSMAVLDALEVGCAVVPDLWFLEVANVAALCEQRGTLRAADRDQFLGLLRKLRMQIDHASGDRIWGEVYDLALKHKLTAYDGRYLELAKRMNLQLATADAELKAAAKKEGVELFAGKA